MKVRFTPKVIAILAVVVIAASGLGYAAYVSSLPSVCAGITVPSGNNSTNAATPASRASEPIPASPSHAAVASVPIRAVRLAAGQKLDVVAAENFWGSLVAQLGGNNTSVLSIVTDPNTDPHEYEANASVAVALSNAQFVIVNGVGYDDWATEILAADGNPTQVVLNVGALNGVSVDGGIVSGNPHMWYNPNYVLRTLSTMYSDLVGLDPNATTDFQANYAKLNVSLDSIYANATNLREHYAGTVVASTESIFVYLANYTDLNLVSPPEFMMAIAEGNDPPEASVVEFQCQLQSGHVRVLVYNQQTVTPITTQMKAVAAENNVTVIGVTETIQPPNDTFQQWMGGEYQQLELALEAPTLGE